MSDIKQRLFGLHFSAFTGKTILTMDQLRKVIFFRKGKPIFVDSSVRSETLGQMLLEESRLTEDQYRSVLAKMQDTGRRQGEIIVELGYLSGFEVYEALQKQAVCKLQNCFLLDRAEIETCEGEQHLQNVPELPLDLFRTFLDLTYAAFGGEDGEDFPSDRALKLTDEGSAYLKTQSLKPQEAKIVHLLDGKFNLEKMLETAGGDPDEVGAFVRALESFGFIQLTDLPLQHFYKPASEVAQPEEKPAEAEKRPEEVISPGRRVVTIEGENEPKEKVKKPVTPAKSSPIYSWALRIDRPLHEFLAVPRQATKHDIRKAFDKAVHDLKLGSIGENYQDKEAEIAEAVLDRLTLAVTVLEDDKRRHQYMQEAAKPNQTEEPSNAIKAEACVQKAKVLMAKKRWDQAEEEISKAIELEPKESSYHVELADLFMHRAVEEKISPLPDVIENELKTAIKLNSSDLKAFVQYGVLAKLQGDLEKARGAFQRALDLSPNHAQALAEIRLINMRLDGKKKGESSLLKLFKKK